MTYSKKTRTAAGVATAATLLMAGVSSTAFASGRVSAQGDGIELGAEFTDRIPARSTGGTIIPVTVTGGTVGATPQAFSAMRVTARVGGKSAQVTYVDETHLKVVAPATTSATAVTMQLTRRGTAGPESAATVAYYPGIVAVTPARISSLGGTLVTVNGTGFLGVDPDDPQAVTFGDAAATSVTVVSATKITAVAPAGTNGTAVVKVKSTGGASEANGSSKVNYRAALGIDTTAAPTAKASGGPLLLTITGGKAGGDIKEFNAERIGVLAGKKALSTTWVDETHLKVVMPPMTTDTAALTITHDTIAGEPSDVSIAPVVTSLSAKTDTIAGGTRVAVRVAGASAGDSTGFKFGDNAAVCAKQGSGATLVFQCTVPPASQGGPVAVTFTSGTGKASRFTAAAMFSYTEN
ncbi:IPT/TIG domain-containing protein [Actinoplanes sp. NPDC020271]|uniref:IPT/TIG domain-containing protein n=1 Tax=Actinoplanes sp. NPDC020271 TaxID=3363896 RepID=UPI00379869F8